jgi:flagellar hook assembly protein FlgD
MDGQQNAGEIETVWDGRNSSGDQVASGIYFYQLEAKGSDGQQFASMKRMVLIK